MPRIHKFNHPLLGQTLYVLRERAQLTQEGVVKAVKDEQKGQIGVTWLSRIEQGRAAPSDGLLDQLLAVLGSDHDELDRLLDEARNARDNEDWSASVQDVPQAPSAYLNMHDTGAQSFSSRTRGLTSAPGPALYSTASSESLGDEDVLLGAYRNLSLSDKQSLLSIATSLPKGKL